MNLEKIIKNVKEVEIRFHAANECVYAFLREKFPHSYHITFEERELMRHSKTLGGSYKYLVKYYRKQL